MTTHFKSTDIYCICVSTSAFLTPYAGKHVDVCLVQERQSIVVDVKIWQVRDEIISHKETHQDPVIYYSLQVISRT